MNILEAANSGKKCKRPLEKFKNGVFVRKSVISKTFYEVFDDHKKINISDDDFLADDWMICEENPFDVVIKKGEKRYIEAEVIKDVYRKDNAAMVNLNIFSGAGIISKNILLSKEDIK